MVKVVDEVVGEQLERGLGVGGPAGAAAAEDRHGFHGRLRPEGGQVALRERFSEADGQRLGAQAEQGERLGDASEGRSEVFGLISRGRLGRASHARVHDWSERGGRRAARGRRCQGPRVGGRRGGAGGGPRHRRLLWPLLEQRERPLCEAVGERLHEVRVQHPAVRTGHRVRVVGVVQPLLRVEERLVAVVAL